MMDEGAPELEETSQAENEPWEKKRNYYKKTEIGTYLLIGGFTLSIFTAILSLVPCIGLLTGLVSFGLIVAGFAMLLAGCGGFPRSHRVLLLVSLMLLIGGFIITLGVNLIGGIISITSIGASRDHVTGEDLRDMFNSTIPFLYISILPAIMISVGFVLALYRITTRAGKALLISFLVLSIGFNIISPFLREEAIRDVTDDIDPDREYEVDEISKTTEDLASKSYPIQVLVSLPDIILIMAFALTARRIRGLLKNPEK
jgi:hypothetical protein